MPSRRPTRRLTRRDPQVPIEETVGSIGEIVQAGFVGTSSAR